MKRSILGFLLLSYFLILPIAVVGGVVKQNGAVAVLSTGVVVFSAAVVTADDGVATELLLSRHKERAAGESLISESP